MNNNWKHIELFKTANTQEKDENINVASQPNKWRQSDTQSRNRRRNSMTQHNKRPTLQINKDICNNCGKFGHLFRHCKNPIVSFGCVLFRINNNVREYLMICRKDTLGYIDFIREKYVTRL